MGGSGQKVEDVWNLKVVGEQTDEFQVVGDLQKEQVVADAGGEQPRQCSVRQNISHKQLSLCQFNYECISEQIMFISQADALVRWFGWRRSQAAVQRVAAIQSVHIEVRPFFGHNLLFLVHLHDRLISGPLQSDPLLLSLPRFLKFIALVLPLILFLSQTQLHLDFGDQLCDFEFGDFVLFQNMGVFAVELLGCLLGVGVQNQLLQQNCVNFLLGIRGLVFIVDADDRGLVAHAQTQLHQPIPRQTIPPSLIKFESIKSNNMSNQDQQQQNPPHQHKTGSTTHQIAAGDICSRASPLLLRIYADDQDKKTLCLFWAVLFGFALLIAILANFAVPDLYVKMERNVLTTKGENCSFPNSPTNKDLLLVCDNYFNTGQIGQSILGWTPMNQFALNYLQIIPISLAKPLVFTADLMITVYKIHPYFNEQINQTVIQVQQVLSQTAQTLKFDSGSASPLYNKEGKSVIGYTTQLAIIPHLDYYPIFISIKFKQTLNNTLISAMYSQSYAISREFTSYTIIIRYIFFALSIASLILYLLRYVKIPTQKRTIQQFFVAIASILLLMFNDPFYPITVLKPNGASAFFSIMFIVNMIVFLFFIWIVTADRINEEDGKIGTQQVTKKKILYIAVIWIELMVAMMVYSMQQINTAPILASNLQAAYIAAKVIIILSILASIVYIGYRYVQICRVEQQKLWRSNIFMVISSVFIFLITIIVASNQLIPYNYSGSTILLVYGLVNLYVYYLQYMFTITRQEVQKLEQSEFKGEEGHEVLTVASIDVVDVDIKDYEKYEYAGVEGNDGGEEYTGLPMNGKQQPKEEFELE